MESFAFTSSLATPVPIPGHEDEYQSNTPYPYRSEELNRLLWTLQGDLKESLKVMSDKNNCETGLEKYHESSLNGDGWHPISTEPASSPPVSKLFVVVTQLKNWANSWAELHENDLDLRVFRDNKTGEETGDSEDEDGECNDLIRCCDGRECPPDAGKLEVRASSRPFVTVHDYVTAVHPWLLSQRDDILLAMNQESEFTVPLPSETELVVLTITAEELIMDELERFRASRRAHGSVGGGVVVQSTPVSGRTFITEERVEDLDSPVPEGSLDTTEEYLNYLDRVCRS